MNANGSHPPSLKIFIVEDHQDTLESFSYYLQILGHEVFTAVSVKEALEKIPTADCDVLFSDIGLPDGTGWDLLRQLNPPRPIMAVAMSGYGMNADRAKSLESGFCHHLIKPVTPEQIDKVLLEATTKNL